MKIWNLSSLGVLTFALAGCIGHSHDDEDEPSSSLSSASMSSSIDSVSSSSMAMQESSSSTAPISSSSHSMNVSSSSIMSSSSSVTIMPSSSSSSLMASSSSAPPSKSSAGMSSSAPQSSSSTMSSSASLSSSSAANITDLSFSADIAGDQNIQTDSIENLGSALIGLVDGAAYNEFYLGLVAQGLDQAAVSKALSALGPVGTAIAADFIKAFSGQALLPAPEGIILTTNVTPVGSRGVEYGYQVNQVIDDVNVVFHMALRFETQVPTLSALIDGRVGYNVFLDGLQLVVDKLELSTNEVMLTLDSSNPVVVSSGLLDAQVELTADGANIVGVTFNGESLNINLAGSLVNGIIGVDANASGTVNILNATLDLQSGSTTLDVTQPDVTVDMQGVDVSQ